MKKIIKVIGIFLLVLFVFGLFMKYQMSWKITNIGREQSPDGRYSVIFQAVGEADWPFGASHAKVTVKDGKRTVDSFFQDIYDDGVQFIPENYSVEWMKYGCIIHFIGSEQPDSEIEVFYDGRDSFEGYSDEEIEDILRERYGIKNVEKISRDKDGYAIRGDGIDFRADASLALHDSYPQEVFKAVTDELFPERFMRSLDWDVEEGESPDDLVYTPVISMNGSGSQDLNSYCDDICEWLDCCFDRLPYSKAQKMYDSTGIILELPGYEKAIFSFDNMLRLDSYADDKVGFYNNLYTCIERYLNHEYDYFENVPSGKDTIDEANVSDDTLNENDDTLNETGEITDEAIKQWASYDFDVAFDSPDGREYALIPIDRALGSSLYVLMVFNEKGNPDSASLLNADPFNQHGGEARFITFLSDGITGFAALSYAGGSEGLLFETVDGGKSYQEVILPSPKIELPTGEFYNPFVMPEDAWEESDTIYLKVSQGPDGDHHSEKLGGARTVGIYASKDKGKTFEFVREEAE